MSVYNAKQTKRNWSFLTYAIGVVLIIGAFSVGRYIAPPRIKENSKEYILAQAKARGEAQAKMRKEAIQQLVAQEAKNKQLVNQQNAEKVQAEKDKKLQQQNQILDKLGLISLTEFNEWKNIGDNWQIRGIRFRMDLIDNPNKSKNQPKKVSDTTKALLEFVVRRTDDKRPALTRIVVEIYDQNKEFMCPGIVDIAGEDAGLVYVRTADYDLKEKTPTYCRISYSDVKKQKYRNAYPED